jgi:hypothetical protein
MEFESILNCMTAVGISHMARRNKSLYSRYNFEGGGMMSCGCDSTVRSVRTTGPNYSRSGYAGTLDDNNYPSGSDRPSSMRPCRY